MDEPLSNLDAKLRVQTRAELVELHRRLRTTIIYVTHDQVEAMTMGDRIAIMSEGVLQQVGPPQDVYDGAGEPLRRPLHRQPADEHDRGHARHASTATGVSPASPAATCPLPDALAKAVQAGISTRWCWACGPSTSLLDADGPVAVTVTAIESLGHERHVICRLADEQLLIVRQASSDAARPRKRPRCASPSSRTTCTSSIPTTEDADHRVTATSSAAPEPPHPRGRPRLPAPPARVRSSSRSSSSIRSSKNFYLGFFRTPPFPGLPKQYVGFEQYRDVLTSSEFLDSLTVTIVFALFTVPIGIVLGLGLAVLAHQKLKGIGIYRTIFSSTVATSVAVASVIFGTLMNPQVGLLPWLGLDTSPPILDNPKWALLAVSVTTIWQNLGLTFIIMSAGLQTVPDELLEAARGRRRRTVVALLARHAARCCRPRSSSPSWSARSSPSRPSGRSTC